MTALDQIDRCMKCFGLTPECPACDGTYYVRMKQLADEAKRAFVASGKVAGRVYDVDIAFKEGGEPTGIPGRTLERGFYARAHWYDEEARRTTAFGTGDKASDALESLAAHLRRNGL